MAQIDAMKWTPRMEECLCAVGANQTCPSDEGFALQVRLQLIAEKAIEVREHQSNETSSSGPTAPFLYIKALQSHLKDLQCSLSPELQQQRKSLPILEITYINTKNVYSCHTADIPKAHIHYTELCLSETAHTANSPPPIVNSITIPSFERFACFWQSINAIKAWLDLFVQLPPSDFVGFSFPYSAQLARCVVTLYRLSTYADAAWDCQAVRNTVDLLSVLDHLVEKLEQVSRIVGEQSNEDLFMQFAGMMRFFRNFAGTKMAPDGPDLRDSYGDSGMMADSMVMDASWMAMMPPMDFENNSWLEEIFGQR